MASKRKRTPKVYDVEDGELGNRSAAKKAVEEEDAKEREKKAERKRKKQIFRNIRHQIEFYFSEANLTKDRYMMELLHGNSVNWISLEEFLKFKRVQALTDKVKDVRRALSHSDMLELSPDSACVRRKTQIMPKENADECVIYVEGFPKTATIDSVKTIFSQWGNVHYISLPKFENQRPKGFGFVEFENEQMAQATLKAFGEVGCIMEATPPRLHLENNSTPSAADIPIPPAPLSFLLHDKTEEQAATDNLLPPENAACDPEELRRKQEAALEEGEIDGEDGEKENEEGEESDEGEIVEKKKRKKKKHRKKKTDGKIAIEVGSLGLKVMMKKEWKTLRNHYIDMQRLNFRRMKQAMKNAEIEEAETPRYEADMKTLKPRVGVWPRKDAIPEALKKDLEKQEKASKKSPAAGPSGGLEGMKHPWKRKADQDGGQQPQKKKKKTESKPEAGKGRRNNDEWLEKEAMEKVPYVPDCIVRILTDLSQPGAVDAAVQHVRDVVTPENVDVRKELDMIYVRCRDKLSALTLVNAPFFTGSTVLEGAEQAAYWQHVWATFKEKRQRKRGKDKLKHKVDKYMGIPGFADAFSGQLSGYTSSEVHASVGNELTSQGGGLQNGVGAPEIVDIADN